MRRSTGQEYFDLLDDQNSVIGLWEPDGDVAARYDYTEYGSPRFLDACLSGLMQTGTSTVATASNVGNLDIEDALSLSRGRRE